MSRKNAFLANLQALVARMGGAHLTRETRERTMAMFSEIVFTAGFTHLVSAADIGAKHIRTYVGARQREGGAVRTLQNEMAHLRCLLRLAGRGAMLREPSLSNAGLGISGGSRLGKKTALTDEQLREVLLKAVEQGRPGMAALLNLERRLGLRGAEAIHARTDTLTRWLAELEDGGKIEVIEGTKGGRPRTVTVKLLAPAKEAIHEAIRVAEGQGGFLVVRADGSASGGLKQARTIYHSWMHRSGIQPHSARYAFVRDQVGEYLRQGLSLREAYIAVSHDLGHGSGRSRWVRSVYMR